MKRFARLSVLVLLASVAHAMEIGDKLAKILHGEYGRPLVTCATSTNAIQIHTASSDNALSFDGHWQCGKFFAVTWPTGSEWQTAVLKLSMRRPCARTCCLISLPDDADMHTYNISDISYIVPGQLKELCYDGTVLINNTDNATNTTTITLYNGIRNETLFRAEIIGHASVPTTQTTCEQLKLYVKNQLFYQYNGPAIYQTETEWFAHKQKLLSFFVSDPEGRNQNTFYFDFTSGQPTVPPDDTPSGITNTRANVSD